MQLMRRRPRNGDLRAAPPSGQLDSARLFAHDLQNYRNVFRARRIRGGRQWGPEGQPPWKFTFRASGIGFASHAKHGCKKTRFSL